MWLLLTALAFLLIVSSMFVAGGLAFTTTLGEVNPTAIGVLMFAVVTLGIAAYLSAKKSRNEPQRPLDEEAGEPVGSLKHGSATASTRQAVGENSEWS